MTTNQTLANEARAEARRLAENYGRGYANAQRLLTALADALERQAGVTWERPLTMKETRIATSLCEVRLHTRTGREILEGCPSCRNDILRLVDVPREGV